MTCSLVDHCCLPITMYACESFTWTTSMFLSLDGTYFQAFAKIFKSFDKSTIRHCHFYMRCLPIELRIIEKKVKFLKDLVNNQNILNLSFIDACDELQSLYDKYQISNNLSLRECLWNYFQRNVIMMG